MNARFVSMTFLCAGTTTIDLSPLMFDWTQHSHSNEAEVDGRSIATRWRRADRLPLDCERWNLYPAHLGAAKEYNPIPRPKLSSSNPSSSGHTLFRAAGGEQHAFLVFRFLHPPWREALCPPGSAACAAWKDALRSLQVPRSAAAARGPPCRELIGGVRIDLYRLFHEVCRRGGAAAVHHARSFRAIALSLGVPSRYTAASAAIAALYRRRLLALESIELRRPRPPPCPSCC